MFIKLEQYLRPGTYKYYNVNDIRSFEEGQEGGTYLHLTYGADAVIETPEQINNLIWRTENAVRHEA